MSPRVLLVEDQDPQRESLALYLEREGYQVLQAPTGTKAWGLFLSEALDLVILDLMLPDISGEALCRRIREKSQVPVMMLTAKVQEESALQGFSLGADDYVRKPVGPREVVARVKALMARKAPGPTASSSGSEAPGGLQVWRDLVLDPENRQARWQNQPLDLTPHELDLLEVFLTQKGRVFTRQQLIQAIWPQDEGVSDRAVDSQVKNLRKKLRTAGAGDPVETLYALGYRWKDSP